MTPSNDSGQSVDLPVFESCARSERQRRNQNSRAQRRTAQREEQREESGGANVQSRDEAQRPRAAVTQRPKPAEFREERERETLAGTMAGSAPIYSYKGSATARNARGDHSHAHTKRDAHLASLTPLIERLIRRARAQRR